MPPWAKDSNHWLIEEKYVYEFAITASMPSICVGLLSQFLFGTLLMQLNVLLGLCPFSNVIV